MHIVQEIKQDISHLSVWELTRFREWYDEFNAKIWDKQFKNDVESGKFDSLAENAIEGDRAGKAQE